MDSPSPGPSPALQAQNPAHRPPPPQGSGHPLLPALPYPHSDWPPGQYPPTGPPAQIQAGSSWAQVARAQFASEDLATCLLLPRHDLEGDGELSHETCIPPELKERLADISPFCKHYMLHLDPGNIIFDPKNPKYKRWSHAIPT
ncbi:hypothetical protein SNK03_002530 [Fusarium graminearum]